jgi:hypothetical protein
MTDESRGAGRELGGTVGPPWSVDVLADLHAGVLEDHEAAELWPRVNADPQALAIIEALESTTADLALLTAGPVEPMPAHFAARLDAALANEAGIQRGEPAVAPVVSLDAARKRRNKRLGWGTGVLAVAAAAVAAVAIALPSGQQEDGSTVAAPPPPSSSQTGLGEPVGSDGSGAEALVGKALGVRDYGPLGTEDRLDSCLSAAGLDPQIRPAGVRPVTVDGKTGVLVILTTGKIAQYRTIAFDADCGPGNPSVLFDKVIGQK